MKNILIFLGIAALIYWYKNRDKQPGAAPDPWLKSGIFGLFPTSAAAKTTAITPITSSPTVTTDSGVSGSSSGYTSGNTDGNVYTGAASDGMVAAAYFTSFSKPKSAFQ